MSISAIPPASQSALIGINQALRQVDQIAQQVAGGIQNQSGSSLTDSLGSTVQLVLIKQQVAANGRVLDTASQLVDELGSMLRL